MSERLSFFVLSRCFGNLQVIQNCRCPSESLCLPLWNVCFPMVNVYFPSVNVCSPSVNIENIRVMCLFLKPGCSRRQPIVDNGGSWCRLNFCKYEGRYIAKIG